MSQQFFKKISLQSIFCVADTVSSSSGVYSGAGSEGSNSPDSHHVARLLVTQPATLTAAPDRRPTREQQLVNGKAIGRDPTSGSRSDLLLVAKTTGNDIYGELAAVGNGEATGGGSGGSGGQFPKCGRKMVERANSRVANLSGLVRLPFARLPQQLQQQQQQQQLSAAAVGSSSRQLREF